MQQTTRWLAMTSLLFAVEACSSDYTVLGSNAHGATSSSPPPSTAGATNGSSASGGGGSSGNGGGASGGGAASTASPTALPQIRSSGGTVLATPSIVPVLYVGDPLQPKIEAFFNSLAGSTYWSTLASNYGIGNLTVSKPIVVSDTPPLAADESGLKSWFQENLSGASPALGEPDQNSIYMLFLAPQTIATYLGAQLCGGTLSGYHADGVLAGGKPFTYAVVARCSVTNVDTLTIEASHQLVDAAANPYPTSAPAFVATDASFLLWATMPGAQVATMCQSSSPSSVFSSELGFSVHQAWSNTAAAAGHAPCFPQAPGDVYFNTSPVLTEDVMLKGQMTKGMQLAVGESKTIDLALFSDGDPGAPWMVDMVQETASGQTELTFDLQPTTGKGGDTLKLKVTRVQAGASDWDGGTPFFVRSTLGATQRKWPVYVAL
jgi:hypothetical protein